MYGRALAMKNHMQPLSSVGTVNDSDHDGLISWVHDFLDTQAATGKSLSAVLQGQGYEEEQSQFLTSTPDVSIAQTAISGLQMTLPGIACSLWHTTQRYTAEHRR